MAEVLLFDTTLRDGEQSRDFNPDFEERLRIALQLDRVGIDVIELASSDDDETRLADSASIAGRLENATACCLATTDEGAIEVAHSVLANTAKTRIHLYLDARRVHAMMDSDSERKAALEAVTAAIEFARPRFDQVQFSPQDASRANAQSLRELAACAFAAGAQTFSIADTVGTASPAHIGELFDFVREPFADDADVIWSIHAHDHAGNAVDNVITAIENGVRQVEGTLGGIGPSGGNTDLIKVLARLPVLGRQKSDDPASTEALPTELSDYDLFGEFYSGQDFLRRSGQREQVETGGRQQQRAGAPEQAPPGQNFFDQHEHGDGGDAEQVHDATDEQQQH